MSGRLRSQSSLLAVFARVGAIRGPNVHEQGSPVFQWRCGVISCYRSGRLEVEGLDVVVPERRREALDLLGQVGSQQPLVVAHEAVVAVL
jgi:hypothetical protein